ncbi:SDR family NAD(P)-dependent oxidoreductase [Caballeronia zhejiangensis]|uniref:SDR family NAD(P)-dependent oxidoreductase n=1 Tax=Caballeronia zhejiangensis TaxID=871203 RepID=UPI001EF721B0|nr:SDR family NAD(P)-dependent oxidoreductase [Caballeronia zhejiangensis]MCG7400325.1 SDR family oxidoreductase [Caballeronia zhejiangensis]
MLNFGLAGRVVVVTGGASGIGLASVIALAADGARVAVLDANEAGVQKAVEQARAVSASPDGVTGAVIDVRDKAVLDVAAARVEEQLGPVNALIASAGVAGAGKAEDLTLDEWDHVFAVNVGGAFATCQAFARAMLARRAGSIVLLGSVDALGGQPGRTHYTASKHAIAGMVKNLAIEWGSRGVRVNGVAPNLVDTPMVQRGVPPRFIRDVVEDRTPLGRMARPEEIASASLMLLSDAASYVNGVMLALDGGLLAGPFTRRQGNDLGSRKLLEAGVYSED